MARVRGGVRGVMMTNAWRCLLELAELRGGRSASFRGWAGQRYRDEHQCDADTDGMRGRAARERRGGPALRERRGEVFRSTRSKPGGAEGGHGGSEGDHCATHSVGEVPRSAMMTIRFGGVVV